MRTAKNHPIFGFPTSSIFSDSDYRWKTNFCQHRAKARQWSKSCQIQAFRTEPFVTRSKGIFQIRLVEQPTTRFGNQVWTKCSKLKKVWIIFQNPESKNFPPRDLISFFEKYIPSLFPKRENFYPRDRFSFFKREFLSQGLIFLTWERISLPGICISILK